MGQRNKTVTKEIGTAQKLAAFLQKKGKWVWKLLICDSCMLNVCFRKYSMPFYFCQIFLYNSEENTLYSVYECAF